MASGAKIKPGERGEALHREPPQLSILNECGKWNPDAIEARLAHVEGNAVRRAYARAEFWDERVKMMEWWGDKLDQLRRGADIIPITAAR